MNNLKTKLLSQLTKTLPVFTLRGPQNPLITGISSDSRCVEAGNIFVAYKGVGVDGHAYVDDALRRGVSAVVVEEGASLTLPAGVTCLRVPNGREALAHLSAAWYGYPGQKMTVIGVTGTDGKTSTINLIFAILRRAGRKVGMISTVNAVIGDESLDTGLHTTTPDAPDVQRYLAQMAAAGVEICLLESTSHGLAQHRVTACYFDWAVVTNITHEHLDIHGSLNAYRQAKARLFQLAQRGVVLNRDDWSFDFLQEKISPNVSILTYSLTHPATLRAEQIILRPEATVFEVQGCGDAGERGSRGVGERVPLPQREGLGEGEIPSGQQAAVMPSNLSGQKPTLSPALPLKGGGGNTFTVKSPLVGLFNVSNILAALTLTVEGLGVEPEMALNALRKFKGVPGRMERIDEGQNFTALVDFAHTPNSLRRALETVRALTAGRVIAVFGCAGLRDVEKRTLMGDIAAELADITLLTAEDPRTEDLDAIIQTTASAMRKKGAVEAQIGESITVTPAFIRIPDRGRALYRAAQLARPGDIVIALGKGHEQSMCFGAVEHPWDDREAMRSALNGYPLLTLPTARR